MSNVMHYGSKGRGLRGAVKLCIRATVLLQNFGGLAISAWNLSGAAMTPS